MTSRPELPEGCHVLRKMDEFMSRITAARYPAVVDMWAIVRTKPVDGGTEVTTIYLTTDEILRLAEHVKGVQRG